MGRRKTNFGCTVEGCQSRANARGLCHMHWKRWHLYGDPMKTKTAPTGEPSAFLDRAAQSVTDDCIEWPYAKQKTGYGVFQVGKSTRPAHREQCIRAHGQPPTDEHQAAHNCGNSSCVNPRHLRWDTPNGNTADTLLHGTRPRGETQGHSKLTADDVLSIRSLHAAGERPIDIARFFKISDAHVSRICLRQSWAWLEKPARSQADTPRERPRNEVR